MSRPMPGEARRYLARLIGNASNIIEYYGKPGWDMETNLENMTGYAELAKRAIELDYARHRPEEKEADHG